MTTFVAAGPARVDGARDECGETGHAATTQHDGDDAGADEAGPEPLAVSVGGRRDERWPHTRAGRRRRQTVTGGAAGGP